MQDRYYTYVRTCNRHSKCQRSHMHTDAFLIFVHCTEVRIGVCKAKNCEGSVGDVCSHLASQQTRNIQKNDVWDRNGSWHIFWASQNQLARGFCVAWCWGGGHVKWCHEVAKPVRIGRFPFPFPPSFFYLLFFSILCPFSFLLPLLLLLLPTTQQPVAKSVRSGVRMDPKWDGPGGGQNPSVL